MSSWRDLTAADRARELDTPASRERSAESQEARDQRAFLRDQYSDEQSSPSMTEADWHADILACGPSSPLWPCLPESLRYEYSLPATVRARIAAQDLAAARDAEDVRRQELADRAAHPERWGDCPF